MAFEHVPSTILTKDSLFDSQDQYHFEVPEDALQKREAIFPWVIKKCQERGLSHLTCFASMQYLDRLDVLKANHISRDDLQIITLMCMLLAAKYHETSDVLEFLIPSIHRVGLDRDQLTAWEMLVFRGLKYDLTSPNIAAFLSVFLDIGILFPDELHDLIVPTKELVYEVIMHIASLYFLDPYYSSFRPNDVAGSIIYKLREALGIFPVWRKELTSLTRFEPELFVNTLLENIHSEDIVTHLNIALTRALGIATTTSTPISITTTDAVVYPTYESTYTSVEDYSQMSLITSMENKVELVERESPDCVNAIDQINDNRMEPIVSNMCTLDNEEIHPTTTTTTIIIPSQLTRPKPLKRSIHDLSTTSTITTTNNINIIPSKHESTIITTSSSFERCDPNTNQTYFKRNRRHSKDTH